MSRGRTKREIAISVNLSTENNKLSWFCVASKFECKIITIDRGWYKKTGTFKNDENWMHEIKLRNSKQHLRISDHDFQRIINKFPNENKHLTQ